MTDKKNLYTIKEFSELTDISPNALRYYDKIGLFSPSFKDPNTGYRYYTLNEFESIGVIQTLQQLGLTLEEIRDYMKNKTVFSSYKLLKKQHENIAAKIEELALLKHYLTEKIELLDSIISDSVNEKIIHKKYTQRMGYGSDKICRSYEEIKSESARIIEKYSKSLFISSSYAVYIPGSDLISGAFRENFYCVIFDIIKEENTSFRKIIFPAGEYVTCRYCGTSFERNATVNKLLAYINSKGYKISGDAVQLCIIDENLTNLDSEKINEIQIPISRC